jgi:hypothetical protein
VCEESTPNDPADRAGSIHDVAHTSLSTRASCAGTQRIRKREGRTNVGPFLRRASAPSDVKPGRTPCRSGAARSWPSPGTAGSAQGRNWTWPTRPDIPFHVTSPEPK